jgi:hypothetical protein
MSAAATNAATFTLLSKFAICWTPCNPVNPVAGSGSSRSWPTAQGIIAATRSIRQNWRENWAGSRGKVSKQAYKTVHWYVHNSAWWRRILRKGYEGSRIGLVPFEG